MSQPNILMIVADDMGYGDFGCLNDGLADTPHINRIVAEGALCTQHYSANHC